MWSRSPVLAASSTSPVSSATTCPARCLSRGIFAPRRRRCSKISRPRSTASAPRFEHVVKFNTFLTDIRAQIPIYREVRDRYVSTAAPPASTTVEIPRLAREGALTEVEAIAVLPPR